MKLDRSQFLMVNRCMTKIFIEIFVGFEHKIVFVDELERVRFIKETSLKQCFQTKSQLRRRMSHLWLCRIRSHLVLFEWTRKKRFSFNLFVSARINSVDLIPCGVETFEEQFYGVFSIRNLFSSIKVEVVSRFPFEKKTSSNGESFCCREIRFDSSTIDFFNGNFADDFVRWTFVYSRTFSGSRRRRTDFKLFESVRIRLATKRKSNRRSARSSSDDSKFDNRKIEKKWFSSNFE